MCSLDIIKDEKDKFFGKIVDLAADAVLSVDERLNLVFFNKEAERLFGYSSGEIIGCHLNKLIPERFHEFHGHHVRQFIESGVVAKLMNDRVSLEVVGMKKDMTEFFAEISIINIRLKAGIFLVAIIRDISRSKEVEKKLKMFAEYDALTGIFNRRMIEEMMKKEMERAIRYDKGLALLVLDIDHFKNVNDTHGHDVGDLALKHLVDVVKNNLRRIDYLGRWGGEEFVVLMPEMDEKGLMVVAEKLRALVESNTLAVDGCSLIPFTISIGGAIYNKSDVDLALFFKKADQALYLAKTRGRNQFCMYQDKN